MSEHDPLCQAPQYWHSPGTAMATCQCALIAKVRADERATIKYEMGVLQWEGLRLRQERAGLHAKVEALPPLQMRRPDDMYAAYVQRADVLALIDGAE